jgi:hypothetical protein
MKNLTPQEVLAEARWHLAPERKEDWRAPYPRPESPAGYLYVGDFGDAGELVEKLTEALDATLRRLDQTPPSREVEAMNAVLAAVEKATGFVDQVALGELHEAITICKRWLATGETGT